MANIFHRVTKEYRTSVNDSDISELDWLVNPDITFVKNLPWRYWIIENEQLRPATEEEKLEIDREVKNG